MGSRVYGRTSREQKRPTRFDRPTMLYWAILFFLGVYALRLMFLMVFQHNFYVALAQGSQEIYSKLIPERGTVYVQDSRTGAESPLAMNADYFIVFADTRDIESNDQAEDIAEALAEVFSYDDEQKLSVYLKLQKENDPYEPIEKKVSHEIVDRLKEKELPGIGFIRRSYRYYPEGNLAAHVAGFLGKDDTGEQDIGRYGVEGYWNKELSGTGGFLEGVRAASGGWISLAGKSFKPAEDGSDILLSIDRTLQFAACEQLRKGLEEYEATSASLVIMDPHTGAIRAMCSLPDFDPNTYNEVESIEVYNNTSIFTPYEPGSIFKPVTMAAAINENVLTQNSIFYDSGEREANCQKPIRNADGKIYEDQTMTGVLENSINTGMVYVAEQVGKRKFREYIEKFGFGVKEGVELDTERAGNIDTLTIAGDDRLDCYAATASFGQGITATPIQMTAAIGAIANGGSLMKPYIVEEIRHSDGTVERTKPTEIRKVLSPRAAKLVGGMMVSVVDSGHAGRAKVDGYYVAGKTGTAQIAGKGGYTDETNHSFVGFAPADDPRYVMIVKFEKPQRRFSASTAATVFGDVSRFLLKYYQVPPSR